MDQISEQVQQLVDRATTSQTRPITQSPSELRPRYTRAERATDLKEPGACPECGSPPGVPGYVRADLPPPDPNFGKPLPCPACHAGKLAGRLAASSQLGGWLASVTFDGYDVTPGNRDGYDAAWQFAQGPRAWLTLWGDFGVGKTHLLAAVANHLVGRNVAAVYYTLPDLMDVLRGAVGGGEFDATFHRVLNVPVLLVDEVDKVNRTDWAVEKAYELFDARYRALDRQGTVFAMNVRPVVTGDTWDYLFSRMHDRRNRVVEVGGGDVRPVAKGA